MLADAHCYSATTHFLPPSITKKCKNPLICFFQTVKKAILPVLFGFVFCESPEVFIASKTYTERKGKNVLGEWLTCCDL